MRGGSFEAKQINTIQAIQRDLKDAGINHPDEWRKALDLDTPLAGEARLDIEQVEQSKTQIKTGKIDNESWQRHLDTAFKQNNYALIKTLQRVRPDSFPSLDVVRGSLNQLAVSRPRDWVQKFQQVRSLLKIEADPAILSAEFGKLLERVGQEKGIIGQLQTFTSVTVYKPDPEVVQTKYRALLAGKKSPGFETETLFTDLKNLTKVKPDSSIFYEILKQGDIIRAKEVAPLLGVEITSEMVQGYYKDAFERNGYMDTYLIAKIGEKPRAELVQRAYQKITEKQVGPWIDSIRRLSAATGVKPIFTEEHVRSFIKKCLDRDWDDGVKEIVELTGIKPDANSVKAAALKIIDDKNTSMDKGKTIKAGIKHLSESVGIQFEITESEIQDRYQKAITDKKPHILVNLYGAFDIKPSVDKETARLFMVELMDNAYCDDYIPELELVFGVKFNATPEEVKVKQDKNLEEFNFYQIETIEKITGKAVDKQEIATTLARWLEQEASIPSHKRAYYDTRWEEEIKRWLDRFGVVIPPEVAKKIYTGLVQTETYYSDNLTKVHQLSGVPIPECLVQQAYQRFLSPDYTYTAETGDGVIQGLGTVSDAFKKLLKISGVKPEIPDDQLQNFYRSCLDYAPLSGRGVDSLQKMAEITGVKPQFAPRDIQEYYKQLVLSGREFHIRTVREATGIELQLDEETIAHISRQIAAGIEKARPGDYEKKFDANSFQADLGDVRSLVAVTKIMPDVDKLQSVYSEILIRDPFWIGKIILLVRATGIKPVFTPEQLQAKGEQLVAQSLFHEFEHLPSYGEFTITPEAAAKAYDTLLAMYNKHDDDWVDRIKRFKKISRVDPTEAQSAEIFSHILQDGRIARNSYGDGVEEKIKFFDENFQMEITGEMAKNIAISYLARGDVNGMKKFVEKIGITPKLTEEDLIPHVNRLLETKELKSLADIKQEMKLARIPAGEIAIQRAYQHFASQADFGEEKSESLSAFIQIFELTGVPANFSAEQIDRVYKTSRFAEWQRLNEITGALPGNEVIQSKYLQFLTGGHSDLDKNIEAIRTLTGHSLSAEIISKALERFASEGKIWEMAKIVHLVGGNPTINPESGQKAYRKIIEQFNNRGSIYWGGGKNKALSLLNDTLEIRPDGETIYQLYAKTLGVTDYENPHDGPDGNRINPPFWEFLFRKFGKPEPEVVQRLYLAQLTA